MDDFNIMPDDSLSQYSTAAGGQGNEESTTQTPASTILQDNVAGEEMFFVGRLKMVLEVSDDRTAEEAKNFLKVYVKICC